MSDLRLQPPPLFFYILLHFFGQLAEVMQVQTQAGFLKTSTLQQIIIGTYSSGSTREVYSNVQATNSAQSG